MSIDLSQEWRWIDGWESVTHTSRRTAGDLTSLVQGALRAPVSLREREASGGVYRGDDVVWELPAANVTYDPKPADLITDADDNEYTVLEVRGPLYGDFWACTCRDLVLAGDLDESVDHLAASAVVNAYGSRVVTHAVAATDIPARIQEVEGEVGVDSLGKRATYRRYRIFLAQELDLAQDDLLRDEAGNEYEVVGWRNKESITDFFTVEARRKT